MQLLFLLLFRGKGKNVYFLVLIGMVMGNFFGVSVSTVPVGPITFLGILVVSLSRQLLKSYRHKEMTIVSTLIGCLALNFGLIDFIINFIMLKSI